MSQSGYTPIQLYRTTTAAGVPSAANLAAGEVALNTTDEKLYFKNTAGTVKLLASNAGSLGSVTSVDVSGGTPGLTTSGGPVTASGTITLAGTLGVPNGGTGATSLTSGYLVKGNGTAAASASVVYDTGTNVLIGTTTASPNSCVYVNNTEARIQSRNSTSGANGYIGALSTNEWRGAWTISSTLVTFGTNDTERMRLDTSGNVIIGTTSASALLTINGSMALNAPVTTTAATYAVAATDNWIIANRAGTVTVTLPTASLATGRVLTIKTVQAQTVVSASSNVVPIGSTAAGTAILAATAGKFAKLVSDGTNWVILEAN